MAKNKQIYWYQWLLYYFGLFLDCVKYPSFSKNNLINNLINQQLDSVDILISIDNNI